MVSILLAGFGFGAFNVGPSGIFSCHSFGVGETVFCFIQVYTVHRTAKDEMKAIALREGVQG